MTNTAKITPATTLISHPDGCSVPVMASGFGGVGTVAVVVVVEVVAEIVVVLGSVVFEVAGGGGDPEKRAF